MIGSACLRKFQRSGEGSLGKLSCSKPLLPPFSISSSASSRLLHQKQANVPSLDDSPLLVALVSRGDRDNRYWLEVLGCPNSNHDRQAVPLVQSSSFDSYTSGSFRQWINSFKYISTICTKSAAFFFLWAHSSPKKSTASRAVERSRQFPSFSPPSSSDGGFYRPIYPYPPPGRWFSPAPSPHSYPPLSHPSIRQKIPWPPCSMARPAYLLLSDGSLIFVPSIVSILRESSM